VCGLASSNYLSPSKVEKGRATSVFNIDPSLKRLLASRQENLPISGRSLNFIFSGDLSALKRAPYGSPINRQPKPSRSSSFGRRIPRR
jgi:hypothetical protein